MSTVDGSFFLINTYAHYHTKKKTTTKRPPTLFSNNHHWKPNNFTGFFRQPNLKPSTVTHSPPTTIGNSSNLLTDIRSSSWDNGMRLRHGVSPAIANFNNYRTPAKIPFRPWKTITNDSRTFNPPIAYRRGIADANFFPNFRKFVWTRCGHLGQTRTTVHSA